MWGTTYRAPEHHVKDTNVVEKFREQSMGVVLRPRKRKAVQAPDVTETTDLTELNAALAVLSDDERVARRGERRPHQAHAQATGAQAGQREGQGGEATT